MKIGIEKEVSMRAEDLNPLALVAKDEQTGFPTLAGHRMMVMAMEALGQLLDDLVHSLGKAKLDVILARVGYATGMAVATHLEEFFDFENQEEWLKAGGVMRTLAGLGLEEITEVLRDDQGRVRKFSGMWRDSFQAVAWRDHLGLANEPVCSLLTGTASGYASTVLGQEILVRELACQAAGSEACRFEGRPVIEWGLDPEAVREYFAVPDLREELERLKLEMRNAHEEMARQVAEVERLRRKIHAPTAPAGLIYRSDSMAQALVLAEKVAPTASTVLIQGESGTGKEVLARFIHQASGREKEPFMAINCAALPPNLLESELFGHKKGAFTGADSDKTGLFIEAGRGTLFLDEVGELPLELQAKLLRAIQEKEIRPVGGVRNMPFQARVLAATNRDLRQMVTEGRFREDLFYRLSVFPLRVMPLRQRREDILPLAQHFLLKLRPDHPGFSSEAARRFEAHNWPGNVRELENWVEYAVVLSGNERVRAEHLPQLDHEGSGSPGGNLVRDLPTIEELGRRYLKLILEHTGGNKTEAARILGLSPATLWRRLKQDGD